MKKLNNFLKLAYCLTLIIGLVSGLNNTKVHALEDGAYIVSRTSTYINPDTGLTAKGATSNETGENMAARILAPEVLVEQSNGRTYVTIGLGMASSISNVSIQIQTSSGGGYQPVSFTNTGSSTLNGDTCRHYRFEVVSPYLNISPKFIVEGMGMELEFYIVLNMNSANSGTSIYLSEMVQGNYQEIVPVIEEVVEPVLTAEALAILEAIAIKEEKQIAFMNPEANPLDKANGLSTYFIMRKKENETVENNSSIWVYAMIGVGIGVSSFIIYKKKRRTKS